jgi:pseudaminic acid cytidylyltransferase
MTQGAIAIIPARGGSKRIPSKNIRLFAGRPILAYTIDAAQDSGLFEHVVVSTDSEEIAEVAKAHGADVPFLRDSCLADDMTPVSAATADCLMRMDPSGQRFEFVAQLMPTCPLRASSDVKDSFRQFQETRAESQISIVRYGWQNPWWALRYTEQHKLQPLFKEQLAARSQDLQDLYCPTGAIWWARTTTLRASKTFHLEQRTGWEIPWQRGIDIDTPDDWALAELLLKLNGSAVEVYGGQR